MLRVFTAFSGYDSQCLALNRIGINYDLIGWSEIDKYAIQAHNALFPQWAKRNYGDISKIDWSQVPDFDLFTYSSPCQDFSQAGLQRGGEKGSGTRSSLLWECERAIREKRPKYLLFENVKALTSKNFINVFLQWEHTLERYGYANFAQVLNAKDYGVPQNRERIFMVSILDESAHYEFPKPFPLTRRLKDVLETNVDERYYLKDARLEGFDGKRISNHQWGIVKQPNEISNAITSCDIKDPQKVQEPIVLGWSRSSEGKGEVVNRHPVQVANCVTSAKRDNTQNYIVEPK